MKKVALVTGASSGIGKEIAKQLLQDGLEVYVAARRVEKMKELENLGAITLKMDITEEDDIKRVGYCWRMCYKKSYIKYY